MRPLQCLAMFVVVWGAPGPVASQRSEPQPPILVARTDLVTLPVTVLDRRGRFVAGLRQEHFTVYDGGEPQTIQLFTSEDLPATIGLVIDSSGSMRRHRATVTAAASAFAAMSHPLDEFFTVNFNEAVWSGLPPSVPFTQDADQLRAALSAAPTEGMTALYDAVDRALAHLERGTRDRKALIVVSDGGDNASARPLDAVLAHARRTNVVIHSVRLFDPDDDESSPRVLKTLARDTGGHAYTPKDGKDVARAFEDIAREIRSGYTIGFMPPDAAADGYRPIRVVARTPDNRGLVVRTRPGYYAGPSGTAR